MSFITIENPVDNTLTLQYNGEMYSIEGKSKKEFPADVANHWMFIYGFMEEVQPAPKVEKAEKVEKEVTKAKAVKK